MSKAEVDDGLAQLRAFDIFDWLSPHERFILAARLRPQHASPRRELFRYGERDGADVLLLRGKLQLTARDGRERTISAGDAEARHPIARLRPRQFTAKAVSPVEYLAIGPQVTAALQARSERSRASGAYGVAEIDAAPPGPDSEMQRRIIDALQAGAASLYFDPAGLELLARSPADAISALGADPILTALLLRAANSAVFAGKGPCAEAAAALDRIGADLGLRLLQRESAADRRRDAAAENQRSALAAQAVEASFIASVLARDSGVCAPGRAATAGLLAGIGALLALPWLTGSEPPTPAFTRELGAAVLAQWNLPPEVTTCASTFENWRHEGEGAADLVDLVLAASAMQRIVGGSAGDAPPLTDLPAWRRLALTDFSPQRAATLVAAARDYRQKLRHLLAEGGA